MSTRSADGQRLPVRGATVRFAGKDKRTGRSGKARIRVRFRTAGTRRARAALAGWRAATVAVRVTMPLRRR